MKKFLFLGLAALILGACSGSISQGSYVIGFYNVENLFDTVHDDGTNDYDYTPDGNNAWTLDKYASKQKNIAHAIHEMKVENGAWHAILGLAEVENDHVLADLVKQDEIMDAGFEFVHYDGGDGRGIDCALLYRPEVFSVIESESIPYTFKGSAMDFKLSRKEQRNFSTRDILKVHGKIDGEHLAVYVAHLPSRLGDKASELRSRGAEIIYQDAQKMEKKHPGIKIVVMGDMNDNPEDESMTVWLHGRRSIEEMGEGDYLNPFLDVHAAGIGSLEYKGEWDIFDNILVNANLVKGEGLTIRKTGGRGHYGRVFNAPFLTQQSGRYAGTPLRTFSHGEFLNGYSDHYPTYIIVSK